MLKKCLYFVGLACSLAIVCVAARMNQTEAGKGREWLSWSATQRAIYVNGFINGYLNATHRTCDAADELFERDKPHTLGDSHIPSDYPSARCLAKSDSYSKFGITGDKERDFSAYTSVITDFYQRYPECSRIYYDQLLSLLTDRAYINAEQIHDLTKTGKLHEIR